MSRFSMIVNGNGVSLDVVIPDTIRSKADGESFKCLWLLNPGFAISSSWLSYTMTELAAGKGKTIVVSVSGGDGSYCEWPHAMKWDTYYCKSVWDNVHTLFPCISKKPEDNILLGFKEGGYGALKYALMAPEKFGRGVAVEPDDSVLQKYLKGEVTCHADRRYESVEQAENGVNNLLWLGKEYLASGKASPVLRIVDAAGSRGEELAKELKALGFDVRLHTDRAETGWELANRETVATLGHMNED